MRGNLFTLAPTQKLLAAANGGRGISYLGGCRGPAKIMLSAKSDAGTDPTLDVSIQNAPARNATPFTNGPIDSGLAHRTGTDEAIRVAARYPVIGGITVAAVNAILKKNGTVSSGTLTLAIQADDDGAPSGTDIATATAAAATVTAAGGPVEFRFSLPIDLSAGIYWLVLTSDVTLHAANNIEWLGTGVDSAGNAAQFDEAWAAVDTEALHFWSESYVFAALATFAQVGAVASQQILEVNADRTAFVRPVITIGGTSTPAYYLSITALAVPEE
jgi:hypothetical protein